MRSHQLFSTLTPTHLWCSMLRMELPSEPVTQTCLSCQTQFETFLNLTICGPCTDRHLDRVEAALDRLEAIVRKPCVKCKTGRPPRGATYCGPCAEREQQMYYPAGRYAGD